MFTILQIILLIIILWQVRNLRATVNGLDDLVDLAYNGRRTGGIAQYFGTPSNGVPTKGGKYDS